jgi:hypothetical protein
MFLDINLIMPAISPMDRRKKGKLSAKIQCTIRDIRPVRYRSNAVKWGYQQTKGT